MHSSLVLIYSLLVEISLSPSFPSKQWMDSHQFLSQVAHPGSKSVVIQGSSHNALLLRPKAVGGVIISAVQAWREGKMWLKPWSAKTLLAHVPITAYIRLALHIQLFVYNFFFQISNIINKNVFFWKKIDQYKSLNSEIKDTWTYVYFLQWCSFKERKVCDGERGVKK